MSRLQRVFRDGFRTLHPKVISEIVGDVIVMPARKFVFEFSCENSCSCISFHFTFNRIKYSTT